MSFFPPLPPPEPAPPRYRLPDWIAPPENVAPGKVHLDLAIPDEGRAVVTVPLARVFPTGWELVIGTTFAPYGSPFLREFHHDTESLLRLGILFADGAKLTTPQDGGLHKPVLEQPSRPVMRWLHGGGSGAETRDHFWIWPLPPEGPLELFFLWPSQDLAETSVELRGGTIRAAAEDARVLWEDDRPLPPTEGDVVI